MFPQLGNLELISYVWKSQSYIAVGFPWDFLIGKDFISGGAYSGSHA